MGADPVHRQTSSEAYWTTVNATEAIPGTTTPLTWSFYDDATELSLRETFALMGVLRRRDILLPRDPDQRFIGIFHAHPAANLTRFRSMADLAPGGSGDALEQQFFGTLRSGIAPLNTRRRYPAVAVRMPFVLGRVHARVHALNAEADRWWRDAVGGGAARGAVAPGAGRDRRLVREGAELYRRILVWHGAGTMLTQGLYDQLGRICAGAGLNGRESELVGGLEDVEEGAVVADLWALSRGRLDHNTVIARHGFHGPEEGELSATVWRERPELIDAILEAFAAMSDDDAPELKRARSAADAAGAVGRLMTASGAIGRIRAKPLIALTRLLMPLREVGRGGVVRALDGTRAAARRLGETAVQARALEDRNDVFFLTIDELTGPGGLPPDTRELVAERRARHARYLLTRLPDGWRGNPEPLLSAPQEIGGSSELSGAAASPGSVEGVARVLTSPADGDALAPGEILICHTTDPGWAALMHVSAALVIEVGGPLSHGAIVARELGVPCVIGAQHATSAIRTGDRISVDGSNGRVRILERSTITT